ncbi:putative Ig domain-containing protein [Malonomonas rubra]|nr:putative Ig domain-containing protein [Malonomonas rubra]
MRLMICLLLSCLLFCANSFAEKQVAVIKAIQAIPMQFTVASGLTVEPVLVDGATGYSFSYRWFLNGEELLQDEGARLPGERFSRGDEVAVEVTPINVDGVAMQPLLGFPLTAGNASPVISSTPPTTFTENTFNYQVEASDLDGDQLSYSLESDLAAMTIDTESGLVRWSFDEMPIGVFNVLIVVDDGFGGRAEQAFELNLAHVSKGAME